MEIRILYIVISLILLAASLIFYHEGNNKGKLECMEEIKGIYMPAPSQESYPIPDTSEHY